MASTIRQVAGAAAHVDWSQFEALPALRCAAGVAIPLFVGLAFHQPSISAFGAVGAVSVGFGSFQGAYRSRAAVMNYAALGMGLAMFAGTLAGGSDAATIAAAGVTAFVSGMLVSAGPAAAFVGLQSVVAVLIASGFPAGPRDAAARAAMVLAGGLVQTLLVVLIWPLRRFPAERAALAAAYRSLARYAAGLARAAAAAPEPHTFAATPSLLDDPQPFARAADVLVFQALLDEAERIRASLAAVATRAPRRQEDAGCRAGFYADCGRVLSEIADALDGARAPREPAPLWDPLEACARALPYRVAAEALLGQLRAAWRTAGAMTPEAAGVAAHVRLPPVRTRPPVLDGLTTLRANLSPQSTAFRHALRLTAAVLLATIVNRLWHLPRGYWIPMTAALVLRPEFHDTLARGSARIAGTLLGAAFATLVVHLFAPGSGALALLVLLFVWGCYALFRMNYAIFAACLTAYVVFVLMLSGVAEMTAATTRALYTVYGGILGLAVYAVWPTWAGREVPAALGSMLEAQRTYVASLLGGFADPATADLARLAALRADARLARSNAEAVIERMLAEPDRRAAMTPRAAIGVLAALRRHALGALALHAGLERGVRAAVPGMRPLADAMARSFAVLADAVRSGSPPPPLPPLRDMQLALGPTDALVKDETDLMVDSVNTIAALLGPRQRGRGTADVD